MANCILANVTNTSSVSGDHNGFYDSPAFGSSQISISTNPFVAVGGGSYYLAGDTFRTNGTPNLDAALSADLAQKTTWPPTVVSNFVFSYATNFSPQAVRENTNAPDLGYAYDPLDYVFAGCDVSNSFTVTAGTAIGWFQAYGKSNLGGQPYSFSLDHGAILSLNGTATQPCYYANYAMVQEGGNGNWTDSGGVGSVGFNGGSSVPPPQLSADFTKWTYYSAQGMLRDEGSGSGVGVGCFTNCEFYNIGMSSYYINSMTFANCLLFRDNYNFWYSPNLSFNNCGFYDGCLSMYRISSVFWLIENSAFDGTMFAWQDIYAPGTNETLIDHNAYNTNNFSWTNYPYNPSPGSTNGMLETNGSGTVFVTNYNWETSLFGNFYQPTNIATFHAGSTNASSLGLYWFTTQTNQTIESNSTVTIGYQYVATDASGNPLDYLAPPIPNYISDPSGASNFLTIVTQPGSLTVTQGSNTSISVLAAGVPSPLTYQWFLNGARISDGGGVFGSEDTTLNLSAVQPDLAGNYYVVVTNGFGSVTSSVAALAVVQTQTNFLWPQYVLSPGAYWNVTDISDPAQPVGIGPLQEPFSQDNYGPGLFLTQSIPYPNTVWHTNVTIAITNAFGTTEFGGTSNMGTVFEVYLTGGATNIHNFTGTDGAYPCSQLAISGSTFYGISNVLYGTTSWGGSNGFGTVFKLNADGSGFADLYEFAGTNDGKHPQAGLLIDGNTLYGTTTNSIFKINTDGSDFTRLTNIYGASQLLLSPSGNTLYGTTTNGGTHNLGMLFSIETDGTNLMDLYDFNSGANNGAIPVSGLELYGIGSFLRNGQTTPTLYGTTSRGGLNGYGMVFSINADTTGFTDLHDFNSNGDGAYPVGGLLVSNNNVAGSSYLSPALVGTTFTGGQYNGGTLFTVTNLMSNPGFGTLYSFGATPTNGFKPEGKLASIGTTIYGTTVGGGAYGTGMVFSVNNDGTGFIDLHDFDGTNGASPLAGLALPVADNSNSIWSLDATINVTSNNVSNLVFSIWVDNAYIMYVNGNYVSSVYTSGGPWTAPYAALPDLHIGENDVRVIIGGDDDANDYFAMFIRSTFDSALVTNLFGGTSRGGQNGDGALYEIGPGGGETNLYSFANAPDGYGPVGDLVFSNNTLYGATEDGGETGNGTIFSFTLGSTSDVKLHSFGYTNNNDGTNPEAGLILSGNTLYGTTEYGGSSNYGTIFRIDTDGSNYTTLYSFAGPPDDGEYPKAPLLLLGTNLYGTTYGGGSGSYGTIFVIGTNGSNYQALYTFAYSNGYPAGGLTFFSASNALYGTTEGSEFGGGYGYGTIFSIGTGGSNYWILHSFANTPGLDGENPQAGLTLSGGTLYGTTYYGGVTGFGTIFSIGADGNGYTILQGFFGTVTNNFGQYPQAELLIQSNLLYGTTYQGGAYGYGMVFSINTNQSDFEDVYDFTNSSDGAYPRGGVCSP